MQYLAKAMSLLVVATTLILTSFSAQAAENDASVARAIITTGIVDREPVDNFNDKPIDSTITKVYLFTELRNAAHSQITHRWFLNGKLEAEVSLNIGSNRWRTYSSKNLDKTFHVGNWEVVVVAEDGNILTSQTFSY